MTGESQVRFRAISHFYPQKRRTIGQGHVKIRQQNDWPFHESPFCIRSIPEYSRSFAWAKITHIIYSLTFYDTLAVCSEKGTKKEKGWNRHNDTGHRVLTNSQLSF